MGLVLFLLGVVATARTIDQAQQRTPLLVAARDLEVGHVLSRGDLRVAEIGLSPGIAAIPASEAEDLEGRTVAAPVSAGQVLAETIVSSERPLAQGEGALSLAIPPQHALAGSLAAGEDVSLLATEGDGPAARTTVVAARVRVLSVDTVPLQGTEAVAVTVAVPLNEAPALAHAGAVSVLDVVRLPPASP